MSSPPSADVPPHGDGPGGDTGGGHGSGGDHGGRSTSFGAVAEDYDTYRPAPPPALAELLGDLTDIDTVDLAAGTGLLTRFLAGLGARVTAVEPDARMAALIGQGTTGITVLSGTAEAIPLPSASADLITASSAWHWFDPVAAPVEIARVLRPGGRLVVLWNGVDYDAGWLPDLAALRRRVQGAARPSRFRRRVDLADGLPFATPTTGLIRWEWVRTVEQVVGLLGTFSGALVSGDGARQDLFEAVRSAVASHADDDGMVVLPMACRTIEARRI